MKLCALLLAGLAITSTSAQAAVVKWQLHGVFYNDAGTASGSFLFDTEVETFSKIRLRTNRSASGGGEFNEIFGTEIFDAIVFGRSSSDPDEAQVAFLLDGITIERLKTPGLLPINPGDLAIFAEFSCDNRELCALGMGRNVTNWQPDGVSTLTGKIAPVPLLPALPLLASGLAALGVVGAWRRKR